MIGKLFTPPYPWLPAAIVAFFVVSFALHPFSPFFTHHLADPDDYMRLNEVIAWLNGQSWYDLSVPRLSPGAETTVHWSRLIDVPLAVMALPFVPWLGVTNAVLVASFIVPLLWFVVLLVLLAAQARPFLKDRANLACVMVLFAPILLFNYTPGRVDHHGIQAIIAGFGLYCLGRMILNDRGGLYAVLAAAAFACGFWIGTEALPWAMIFIAALGIAAAVRGGSVARDAAVFGISLPICTAILIPIALPISEFSSRALSWFSPAYVIFAALSGGIFIIAWFVEKSISKTDLIPSSSRRGLGHLLGMIVLYLLLAGAAGLAFFTLIPSAQQGPFADYDDFDATTALENISEAQPLLHALSFNRFMPITLLPACISFMRLLALPLLAIGVCLWAAKRARAEARLLWLMQALFLSVATALTVFYQIRVAPFMEVFAITPLTYLLCALWDKLRWGLWDRKLFWAEIGAFLALGFLPTVLLPAVIAKTPIYPDIALFPAARGATVCPLEPVSAMLNDRDIFGDKPLTIMNTSDVGPELLFTTHDTVIAGNFDVPGNVDTFTFFHASKDAEALAIAHKWHADLVLLCRIAPAMYRGKGYYDWHHMGLQTGQDGLLHFNNTDAEQPLIERLIRGDIPPWLKPIEIYAPSDYLLFRIQETDTKK